MSGLSSQIIKAKIVVIKILIKTYRIIIEILVYRVPDYHAFTVAGLDDFAYRKSRKKFQGTQNGPQ